MLNVLNPFNFFLKDTFTSFSLNLFFFPPQFSKLGVYSEYKR